MRSVAATHDTVLKPTVTEYATYAEIPNVVGLRASVKFGAFFKTAPALATRCAPMPGLSEACAREADARGGARAACGVSRRVVVACARHRSSERFFVQRRRERGARFDAEEDASPMPPPRIRRDVRARGDAANRESLASRAALGLDPRHAVVVLGDLFCANGVAHVVDAPLAPDDFFKTAPTGQARAIRVTDAFF